MTSLLCFNVKEIGANFTLRDMLILTMISIRKHSVLKTHSFHISTWVSMALSCCQSSWFQCIIIDSGIFSWWVSRWVGVWGLHVSKERGAISRRGEWKKGTYTPFRTMHNLLPSPGVKCKKRIAFKAPLTWSVIPWLLNSLDLPNSSSKLTKQYTLKLLLTCLEVVVVWKLLCLELAISSANFEESVIVSYTKNPLIEIISTGWFLFNRKHWRHQVH